MENQHQKEHHHHHHHHEILSSDILEILKQDGHLRSVDEIDQLNKHFSFILEELGINTQKNPFLLSQMKIQTLKRGDLLLKGSYSVDTGCHFNNQSTYFQILHGQLKLWIDEPLITDPRIKLPIPLKNIQQTEQEDGQIFRQSEYINFEEILFGLQKNCKITCKNDCILAYLTIQDIKNAQILQNVSIEYKQEIVNKYQIFQQISPYIQRNLVYHSTILNYTNNQVVQKQFEKCQFVFLVISGKFRYEQKIKKKESQQQKLIPVGNERGQKKSWKILEFDQGSLLNEDDIIKKIQFCTYTIKCVSAQGALFVMPSVLILEFYKRYNSFQKSIDDENVMKNAIINQKLESIDRVIDIYEDYVLPINCSRNINLEQKQKLSIIRQISKTLRPKINKKHTLNITDIIDNLYHVHPIRGSSKKLSLLLNQELNNSCSNEVGTQTQFEDDIAVQQKQENNERPKRNFDTFIHPLIRDRLREMKKLPQIISGDVNRIVKNIKGQGESDAIEINTLSAEKRKDDSYLTNIKKRESQIQPLMALSTNQKKRNSNFLQSHEYIQDLLNVKNMGKKRYSLVKQDNNQQQDQSIDISNSALDLTDQQTNNSQSMSLPYITRNHQKEVSIFLSPQQQSQEKRNSYQQYQTNRMIPSLLKINNSFDAFTPNSKAEQSGTVPSFRRESQSISSFLISNGQSSILDESISSEIQTGKQIIIKKKSLVDKFILQQTSYISNIEIENQPHSMIGKASITPKIQLFQGKAKKSFFKEKFFSKLQEMFPTKQIDGEYQQQCFNDFQIKLNMIKEQIKSPAVGYTNFSTNQIEQIKPFQQTTATKSLISLTCNDLEINTQS